MAPYSDNPEILEEPQINSDLNVIENIEPWKSNDTFKTLEVSDEIREYFVSMYNKYKLLPILRKGYFNERGGSKIEFKEEKPGMRLKLIKSIKNLSVQNLVSDSVKRKIAEKFTKETQKEKINKKVLDLIFVYKVYPESYLEELLEIAVNNPEAINQTLRTVSQKG